VSLLKKTSTEKTRFLAWFYASHLTTETGFLARGFFQQSQKMNADKGNNQRSSAFDILLTVS
jgi:hypothetical protein